MQIRIKEDSVVCGGSIETDEYRKKLQDLAGQWVDVETEHVFGDQFNTSELRVMISNVAEIKDDVRIGAIKCQYCNYTVLNVSDEEADEMPECPRCAAKEAEGHIHYTNNILCVMDRIRPLLTVLQDGKVETVYTKRRMRTIKTPEGPVKIWGKPYRRQHKVQDTSK